MNKKIFCVIPAFNEEKNIEKVLDEVKKHVEEIVVVDDGSSDNTFNIAKDAGAIVLHHMINRGQGAALATGNLYAFKNGADVVVHFDADGQFDASEISLLVEPIIKDEVDVVFGSRFLGKESNLPFVKEKFIIPVGRLVNKVLIGRSLTDPQNGFRALSKKALALIDIRNDGMAHNSEIQHKTFKNNLRYKEVPVTVRYNRFGQGAFSGRGRGSGGIKIVKDLLINKLID